MKTLLALLTVSSAVALLTGCGVEVETDTADAHTPTLASPSETKTDFVLPYTEAHPGASQGESSGDVQAMAFCATATASCAFGDYNCACNRAWSVADRECMWKGGVRSYGSCWGSCDAFGCTGYTNFCCNGG